MRGPIPARLGDLANLIELDLGFIWGLSGPLPSGLIEQSSLKELDIFVTQACAPAAWQEWLATIEFFGVLCEVGDDVTTVDVAIVYTPAARELAGGTARIEAVIDLMVAETNEAYAASGVRHRLALVERSEVRYTEAGDGRIDLERLIDPEDGYMDDVHTLRDRVGADLVHLIVGKAPGLCGVAILPGAFALTVLDCGGIVMAHEIGHNMGLYHDRFSGQLSRGGMSSHPAFGYVNQRLLDADAPPSSRWHTIMAYRSQCRLADVYCSWLPRFSNPRQRHNGDPLGVAYGTGENGATGAADAAAVLNATSPAVAAWRERPAGDNRPPVAAETLPDQTLTLPGALTVGLSRAFVDPDGDALTYAVSSSAPSVVAVTSAGPLVTLTAVREGTATIRVTATDPGGLSATGVFSEDTIRPGEPSSRPVRFTDLPARIDTGENRSYTGTAGGDGRSLRGVGATGAVPRCAVHADPCSARDGTTPGGGSCRVRRIGRDLARASCARKC